MVVNRKIILDGLEMVSYLDSELIRLKKMKRTATGIVIGSTARKHLDKACKKIMGHAENADLTVNKFRGVLLIEDGLNLERLEIIHAEAPAMPVEGNPFPGLIS